MLDPEKLRRWRNSHLGSDKFTLRVNRLLLAFLLRLLWPGLLEPWSDYLEPD
jgi:hypothetical protein